MVALALVLATACAPSPTATPVPAQPTQVPPTAVPTEPPKGGKITVSHGINVPDTLNQKISDNTISRMVAHHILDGLVAVDGRDGSVHPWLATEWEISDGGKVYTFKLRQDVTFHDGTPFNAEAVKFNFDFPFQPDIPHKFAWGAMGGEKYAGTEVVDEYTVKVTFTEPNAVFLVNLSDGGLGIDSPTAMQEAGDDYGVKTVVGSGPFKFKEWVKGSHVTLVRNEDYAWAPAFYENDGPPYLEELTYRDVEDAATRLAALEGAEINFITITPPQASAVEANADLSVLTTPKAGTTRMYLMNLAKPPTDDIRVRQAINHAIDKEGLIMLPAWSGYANPGVAALPSNMIPGGMPDSLKALDFEFDVAKANQLMDDAGWEMGADGVREKDGIKFILDMITTTAGVPQVEPLDQMLRAIGGQLNILSGDFNFWLDTVFEGDFHITLMSDSGYNSPALVWEFFDSEGVYNDYSYSNPEFDAYVRAALGAATQDEVWENLIPALEMINKDAVGVMGFEQLYLYAATNNLKGTYFNEIGFPFFYDAWAE
jgi:peptide/nickel transport system substrate-binding protein